MAFVKHNWTRWVAGTFGAAATIFGILGCGGSTGGTPSGIANALTNATIKVSSFSLTTSSAVNQLNPVTPNVPELSSVVNRVGGALYPTRNSKSFRVVLKGSGVDREDVEFYCDIFDKDATYTQTIPTPKAPYNLTRVDPTGPGGRNVETELRKIWFAQPAKDSDPEQLDAAATQVVPVVQKIVGRAEPIYIYQDTELPVPTVDGVQPVYEIKDAYLYSQFKDRKAVRVGRRNVIVQFFNEGSRPVSEHYRLQAQTADPAKAAEEETEYLTNHLTNTYIFTTEVRPNEEIDLTSGFQTNNGDNGLVDTKLIDARVVGLPPSWNSVKFEIFEESTGLSNQGIVYTEIVNRDSATDATATTATSHTRFANRQRVLKVYATCYEGKDGEGIVLAQTRDYAAGEAGGNNVPEKTYNTPTFPVQFIPSPLALPGPIFPENPTIEPDPDHAPKSAGLLMNMTLALNSVALSATIPTVARGNPIQSSVPQRFSVSATFGREPRYANGVPLPARPASGTAALFSNLSASYTRLTAVPSTEDLPNQGRYQFFLGAIDGTRGQTGIPDQPTADGTVRWQQNAGTYFFSNGEITNVENTTTKRKPVALVQIALPGFTSGAKTIVPVPLEADKGDGSGTVG